MVTVTDTSEDTGPGPSPQLDDVAFARLLEDGDRALTGVSVSAAADFDGDGLADVLLGGPFAIVDRSVNQGGVYLALGPFSGDHPLSADAVYAPGLEEGGRDGWAVAGLGDTDGDGVADVAVGAGETEWVSILCGGSQELFSLEARCAAITGNGGDFGTALSGTGDADGDGYGDLLVGAPLDRSFRGAAYLFNGPFSGQLDESDAQASMINDVQEEAAGYVLAGDGDVNGDGFNDMLLGAPTWGIHYARADDGGLYLFHGPLAGENLTVDASDHFDGWLGDGWSVSLCSDLDGDGYDDVIAGVASTDGYSDETTAVFPGGPEGARLSDGAPVARVSDPGLATYSNWYIQSVGLGDLDADGYDELAVTPAHLDGATGPGASLYVFRGPLAGAVTLDSADWMFFKESRFESRRAYVAPGGDLDDDGHDDIILGVPDMDAAGENNGGGGAYLLSGASL